jgi:hypothetical protein
MSSSREKTKKFLHEKLLFAEQIISRIIDENAFKPEDVISKLLLDIQSRLNGAKVSATKPDEYIELEDIYVNVIIGIMSQDLLAPDDEIKLLMQGIKKRVENFDEYFEKLEKGELKEPFL